MKFWRALRPSDRRALALGALIVVPALGYGGVARPYAHAIAERRTRLAEQRDLLRRELALVSGAPQLAGREEQTLLALSRVRSRAFSGDALSAATGLAAYVTESARRSGVLIEEIQSRPSAEAGPGVSRVEIGARGRSDLAGILRWLRALEGGAKLVQVQRLALDQAGAAPPDSADTEVLTVSTTVQGYVLTVRERR